MSSFMENNYTLSLPLFEYLKINLSLKSIFNPFFRGLSEKKDRISISFFRKN